MTDGSISGRQKAFLFVVGLAVMGLFGAVSSVLEETSPSRPIVAENVAFDLPTTSGARITSAGFDSRPTIVWFWAPWCSYSQDIADDVAAEAKRSGDRVRFVGIGGDASAGSMERFVSTYEVAGMEHGVDVSGEVADRFGATAYPSFAVVYPEGGYSLQDWVDSGEDLHDLVEALDA